MVLQSDVTASEVLVRRDEPARVLMVAYLYPPMDFTGTVRTEKFAKYLPEFGYEPIILTTGSHGSLPDDAARRVFRAPDPLAWTKPAHRPAASHASSTGLVGSLVRRARVKPLLRAAGMVLAPDPEIAWYPFAVRRARQILRAVDIGALYSSSSPETDHLVAWKLKRETGLPWIADFRDGWMFETHRAVRNREGLRRRAELRLERAVVGTADSIVTVNELIADDFRSRYPAAAHRVHVIENGFDPDDLGGLTRHRTADGKMRIVYTGRLALSRTDQSLAPLLAALETLVAGDPDIARDIEVHLIGPLSPHERDEIERSGARELVRIAGPRPRREALQAQLDADVLLLVTGSDAGVSTSKVYEYLATGRPILGLTQSPPAMELVRASTGGTVVDPQYVPAIASSLLHLHARWAEGTLATSPAAPDNRYTRRFLTGRLAALLDRLSGSATHYSGGKETA